MLTKLSQNKSVSDVWARWRYSSTRLSPKMQIRGRGNAVDEVAHSSQQHLRWAEVTWVR